MDVWILSLPIIAYLESPKFLYANFSLKLLSGKFDDWGPILPGVFC